MKSALIEDILKIWSKCFNIKWKKVAKRNKDHIDEYLISPNELKSIPKIIESTYENIDLFKTKVQEARNETVFNFGQSGIKGAQEIVKILHEEKKP